MKEWHTPVLFSVSRGYLDRHGISEQDVITKQLDICLLSMLERAEPLLWEQVAREIVGPNK